jgi:capsular exopolysaccharide synthesis family protein
MARSRTARPAQQGNAERAPSSPLTTIVDPAGSASEAYRGLRTNLLRAQVEDPPKVILLTSPGNREGKSTVCANLAVALAQADRDTLVIDCDFRGPTLHKLFRLGDSSDVPDAMAKEDGLRKVWQSLSPKLKVVAGATAHPNPAEILVSRRFAELLGRARQEFDYVLLDAPPVDPVSDAAILATQADGTLLVMDAQKTRKAALRRAVRGLELVGANVLGVVLNNVEASGEGYPLVGRVDG